MRGYTSRNPVRLRSRRARKKRIWIWATLGALAAIMGFAGFMAFAPFIQISSVRVSGADRVAMERIESRTQELAERRYYFFTTRSIALVSTRAIASALLEEFPSIERIEISRDLPRTLALSLKERVPVLRACSKVSCVAVDAKGFAFENKETDDLSDVFLPAAELTQGSDILSPELVAFLRQAEEALRSDADIKIPAASFALQEEERVEIKTPENWIIIVSPTSDFSWQFSKLKAVLTKQLSPTKRSRLEYIDLRFGDRAFIKYQ